MTTPESINRVAVDGFNQGSEPTDASRVADADREYPRDSQSPATLSVVPDSEDEDGDSGKGKRLWIEVFARFPSKVLLLENNLIIALVVLYGLANNRLARVFVNPDELCRALGVTEEYAAGDLAKALLASGFVTDWSLEYDAKKREYQWAIQLEKVPKNDFLKAMWWWLFENPADNDGDRWVRTKTADGKPWTNRSPALASALAVQRYGKKSDDGVRHSITDTYGTAGLSKAVKFSERTLQKGLVEASERGWIGVSNRLGGKARHAKRWVRWMPDYAETREPGHHGSPDHPNRAVALERRREKKVVSGRAVPGQPSGGLEPDEPPF